MQSMDRTLVQMVQGGQITYEEAKNFAVDLAEFDRMMKG
jgi:twitching motility protein PilT